MAKAKTIDLRFTGQPGQYVPGIPAADVTVDAGLAAELIASGIYERVSADPARETSEE